MGKHRLRRDRLQGAFDDGRAEVIEVQARPSAPPQVATLRLTPLLEGGGRRLLVTWERVPAVATLTGSEARGVPAVALTLDEPAALALRDALSAALEG